jgi:hypothetical protein
MIPKAMFQHIGDNRHYSGFFDIRRLNYIHSQKTFAKAIMHTIPKLIGGYGLQYNPKYKIAVFQEIYGYRLNKKWSIQGQLAENFYDKERITLNEYSLGAEYRKNLNNAGYPLYVETSLWVSYNDIKRERHDRVWEFSIVPQLSLTKQMNHFFTFKVFANYPVVISSNTSKNDKSYLRAGMAIYFLY